jgi:hypothetical protein
MRIAYRWKVLNAFWLAVFLTGCGGGSGSDSGGASVGGQNISDNALKIQVSGLATFASVPNNSATGALDYSATTQKAVRGATIQAIAGTTVLATATTSAQGSYTLTVPANSNFFLRLRAELVNTQGPANWSVAVRDNTAGNALWVVDSVAAAVGSANAERSINAGSGWTATSYTSARAAGPFAILDTVYSGMQLVTSVQSNAQFPALNVYWSPNNIAVRGNLAAGEIGTSFFSTALETSTAGSTVSRFIYILGSQDSDTDEYDSSIVAHEYGHYLESAFAKSNSLGGPHGPLDKLDPTVAFSEGWGNAWSGMVRGSANYADSSGPRQGPGILFSLASVPTDAARGWYREDSTDSSLFRLFTGQGFAPIWSALTGPAKASEDALSTIFSFAAAVRSAGNAAATSALNSLLSAQAIFTGAAADQWGTGETNNGGSPDNLPLYISLTLNTPVQTCLSKANLTGNFPNKLGSVKYYRILLPSSGQRTVRASFSGGRDIDFEVFQKGVLRVDASGTSATSEVANVNLDAGEAVIRVSDFNLATVSASTPCGSLTVN